MDEGKDSSRGTDAERQRKHGRQREDGGMPHLAKCVGDILAQGLHGDPCRTHTSNRGSMFRKLSGALRVTAGYSESDVLEMVAFHHSRWNSSMAATKNSLMS